MSADLLNKEFPAIAKACKEQIPATYASDFFEKIMKELVKDLQTKLNLYLKPSIEVSKMLEEGMPNHLRVLFHNIGKGFQKNIKEIEKMISVLKVDVCFISETGLSDLAEVEETRKIGGLDYHVFNLPMKKEPNGYAKGGLMVLINKSLMSNDDHIIIGKGLRSGEHSPSKSQIPSKYQKLRRTASEPILSIPLEAKFYHQDCFIDLFGVRYIFLYRNQSNTPVLKLSRDFEKMKLNEESNEVGNVVIFGDFNSTDQSTIEDSKNVIKVIKTSFPSHEQRITLPTSHRSQTTIDLLFDSRENPIVEEIFVLPFLDSDKKKDHAPIFFIAKRKEKGRFATSI